jgi:hypothetical protein
MNDPSNVAAMVTLAEATVAARDRANDRLRAIRTLAEKLSQVVEGHYGYSLAGQILELAVPVDGGEDFLRKA